MLEELLPLLPPQVRIERRDIDSNPEWQKKFNIRVPVIEAGERFISGYPLDYGAVSAFLAGLPEISDESAN